MKIIKFKIEVESFYSQIKHSLFAKTNLSINENIIYFY